eukprot:6396214-Amphidinium_carterae.1
MSLRISASLGRMLQTFHCRILKFAPFLTLWTFGTAGASASITEEGKAELAAQPGGSTVGERIAVMCKRL